MKTLRSYIAIVCVTLVFGLLALLAVNWGAQTYLRANPALLMSEADRINENFRLVREQLLPPDKAALWYDLETAEDIAPMWDEYYGAGVEFESYTHFRPKALLGRFYGVTEAGYRRTRQGAPWPPAADNVNVFFFGGSTAFGVGPYWATIASYLEEVMDRSGDFSRPVRVYNFGRPGYISSQELILFHRLLASGASPDIAVFFDGLNDFCFHDGNPSSWQALAAQFNEANERYQRQAAGYGIVTAWYQLADFARGLPVARLVDKVLERTFAAPTPRYTGAAAQSPDVPEPESVLRGVIDRYLHNQRQIRVLATTAGVTPVFVWQPIPTYKYDLRYHLFYPDRIGCHVNSKAGYPIMAEATRLAPPGADFIWAADMQEELREPLYVDAFHYTAPLSRRIAEFIYDRMRERGLGRR